MAAYRITFTKSYLPEGHTIMEVDPNSERAHASFDPEEDRIVFGLGHTVSMRPLHEIKRFEMTAGTFDEEK